MTIFGLIDTIKNARKTLREWGEYKRQTGRWPLLSIAVHAFYFIALLTMGVFLIWYGQKQGWSDGRFVLYFLIILGPFILFWSWVENKVKLNDIHNRRRLAKGGYSR